MPRYRFQAPADHRLEVGEDEYSGGDEVELTEEQAAADSRLIPVDDDSEPEQTPQESINVDTAEPEIVQGQNVQTEDETEAS